jgi:alkylmercury lyase
MTAPEETLSPTERLVHRALLEGFLATGVVPSFDVLADAAGIDAVELPELLAALAAADYLARDPSGVVTCLYPFSPIPTPHVVVVGGHRRHAMCSIDALGMAAMLGRAVAIESSCTECGAPIRLDVSPGTIARAEPPESVVLARRSGDEPACETCCPFTLFACEPAHGEALAARLPETIVVALDEALRHGESIFGDMLGEVLPARRRRSRLTTSRLRT